MLKFEHLRMQMSPKKGESPDVIIVSLQHDLYIRAVGGYGGQPSLPDFGNHLILSQLGGGQIIPHITKPYPLYHPLQLLNDGAKRNLLLYLKIM